MAKRRRAADREAREMREVPAEPDDLIADVDQPPAEVQPDTPAVEPKKRWWRR